MKNEIDWLLIIFLFGLCGCIVLFFTTSQIILPLFNLTFQWREVTITLTETSEVIVAILMGGGPAMTYISELKDALDEYLQLKN